MNESIESMIPYEIEQDVELLMTVMIRILNRDPIHGPYRIEVAKYMVWEVAGPGESIH